MVVIRLSRTGANKNPFYHIVVADQRNPRDGRYIEKIGYYNPVARGKAQCLELNLELMQAWIKKGAQPSERVLNLVKQLSSKNAPIQSKLQSPAPSSKAKKSAATAEKAAVKEETVKPTPAAKEKQAEPATAAKEKQAEPATAAKEKQAEPATADDAPAADPKKDTDKKTDA